eukprot:ctg_2388.g341
MAPRCRRPRAVGPRIACATRRHGTPPARYTLAPASATAAWSCRTFPTVSPSTSTPPPAGSSGTPPRTHPGCPSSAPPGQPASPWWQTPPPSPQSSP